VLGSGALADWRGVHRGVHAVSIRDISAMNDPRNQAVFGWLCGSQWAVQT